MKRQITPKSSQILHDMAVSDPLTGAKNRHALKFFFDDFIEGNGPFQDRYNSRAKMKQIAE